MAVPLSLIDPTAYGLPPLPERFTQPQFQTPRTAPEEPFDPELETLRQTYGRQPGSQSPPRRRFDSSAEFRRYFPILRAYYGAGPKAPAQPVSRVQAQFPNRTFAQPRSFQDDMRHFRTDVEPFYVRINRSRVRVPQIENLRDTKWMGKGGHLTAGKAEKMLHDGTVRGHKITPKQRRFFGAVASGQKPRMAANGASMDTGNPVGIFDLDPQTMQPVSDTPRVIAGEDGEERIDVTPLTPRPTMSGPSPYSQYAEKSSQFPAAMMTAIASARRPVATRYPYLG